MFKSEPSWGEVKLLLAQNFGKAVYDSWFQNLDFDGIEGGFVNLSAPSFFVRDWILNNYLEDLTKFWERNFGYKCKQIIINVRDNDKVSNYPQVSFDFATDDTSLDPRLTFENFIVGSSNEIAYNAAIRVAEGALFNPLFIAGKVGLGKTHLMHAIGWRMRQMNSGKKVLYISSEQFMLEFIKSLRQRDIFAFKERFRNVDVLMIDDIQFMAGKESTEEEFFHTFNILLENHKQVIVCADRTPQDIMGLQERMRSRLNWGLVVQVYPMSGDLKHKLLVAKAKQFGCDLPAEVFNYLEEQNFRNVRDLEGALHKLKLFCLEKKDFSQFKKYLNEGNRPNKFSEREILEAVTKILGITLEDLISNSRKHYLAKARQITIYLLRKFTNFSLVDIGKLMGNRDHTTIKYSLDVANSQISSAKWSDCIQKIENSL